MTISDNVLRSTLNPQILTPIRISRATLTLHRQPLILEIRAVADGVETSITCTNPRPLRSTEAFSEPIDRLEITDRNDDGASLEFARYEITLFIGCEMTERFDCDTCVLERVRYAEQTPKNGIG